MRPRRRRSRLYGQATAYEKCGTWLTPLRAVNTAAVGLSLDGL